MDTLQGVAWIVAAAGGASFLILAGVALLVHNIKARR